MHKSMNSSLTLSPTNAFNFQPTCFRGQELKDYLIDLSEKNKFLCSKSCLLENHFKSGKTAMFMFNVCETIGASKHAMFMSIELFDKYMSVYMSEVDNVLDKLSENNFIYAIEKMADQIELRALSCIQIATKMCLKSSALKCSQIRELLVKEGLYYRIEAVANSERRVLKYLKYGINVVTPHMFVETLLEVLGYNEPNIDTNTFYVVACKLLEAFYYSRNEIYDRLYESFTGRTRETHSDREEFLCIENDYMYLACSIIAASAYILENDMNGVFEKVLDSIASICQLKKEDIHDFSHIICNFALLNEETTPT